MFAAGAAAKIAAGQQDARPGKLRPVELEIAPRRFPVVLVPPIIKQERPIAGPLNPLEKLLGNDLVSINGRPVHRANETGMGGEWLHGSTLAKHPLNPNRLKSIFEMLNLRL